MSRRIQQKIAKRFGQRCGDAVSISFVIGHAKPSFFSLREVEQRQCVLDCVKAKDWGLGKRYAAAKRIAKTFTLTVQ